MQEAGAVGYGNAGTASSCWWEDEVYFHLELNARLQVEHPG